MILAKFFGKAMLMALGVALAANGSAQPSQQGSTDSNTGGCGAPGG